MKAKKITRIITCVVLSVMLLLGAVPVNAVDFAPYDPIFKGRVTATESAVDLSGLEIEVYSAEKVVSEFDDGSDFIYYGMTYDHSVYTDEDGYFTFKKPSECFSYSIKLSSLPKGYGVDNNGHFCYSEDGMREGNIAISLISKVEAEYTGSGDGVIPRMYDGRGNAVMAEYTVTKDEIKAVDYETLVSLDELILTGMITASGVDFAYRVPVDISEMPVMSKIGALFSLGAIDEGKKIEYYCYALQDGRAKIDCGTSVLAEIQSYKNAHADEKLDSSLQNAIDSLIQAQNERQRSLNSYISGDIGFFTYIVFYDSNTITQGGAQAVADEFESIYDYFVNYLGFNEPISDNGAYYKIEINNIPDGSLGYTYSMGYGSSYIEIADHVVANSLIYPNTHNSFKQVIAHEFFHAISLAYDPYVFSYPDNQWFNEGFANFASLVYVGVSEDNINGYMSDYLSQRTDKGFFNATENGGGYGTLFYPYYIYLNCGGWNAIESILYNLPSNPISPSHSTVLQAISDGLYFSTAEYEFLSAATCTYAPTRSFPLATSAWGAPAAPIETFNGSSRQLEGMAYRFHKYTTGSNITNFSCKFNIGGNDPSGMELNVMKTNDSNYYSFSTWTTGYSQIYITLNNLTNTTAIVFCPVNTNAYENISTQMTYSFSLQP